LFQYYDLPSKRLSRKVSDGVDIFKAFTVTKSLPVFRHVYTSPPKEALQKFLKWLKDEVGSNVVLVNIFSTL
jgi:hypothetical protein